MAYKNPEDQKRYAREHYRANAAIYKARAQAASVAKRERIRQYLQQAKDRPCMDCGGSFHYCAMQFDHVRGQKEFTIGAPGQYVTMARVQSEVAKCEVVCANCHAVRTHLRAGLLL
jgi:hypothetical protein